MDGENVKENTNTQNEKEKMSIEKVQDCSEKLIKEVSKFQSILPDLEKKNSHLEKLIADIKQAMKERTVAYEDERKYLQMQVDNSAAKLEWVQKEKLALNEMKQDLMTEIQLYKNKFDLSHLEDKLKD